MAADPTPHSIAYRWAQLINQEAFRRMGATLEIASFPLARRAALVEAGVIDGEISRIYSYADTHPELVRVEEPVMDFTFSLFTAQPGLKALQLADLPADVLLEYRRGVLVCENTLKKVIAPERLSNVTSTEQGIKKLLAGRSDVYCDIDIFVKDVQQSGEFKDEGKLRKLFDIATVATYPYFYKKHASLAPRFAAILKQMKVEGLFAAYRKQAELPPNSGQ
ncbi:MAG: hypothetical protein FD135_3253 [Comamonadaceae bacterium]|nr:MAG: hypothetical protein FD135_3253 [Comamonadaceae bacterium]